MYFKENKTPDRRQKIGDIICDFFLSSSFHTDFYFIIWLCITYFLDSILVGRRGDYLVWLVILDMSRLSLIDHPLKCSVRDYGNSEVTPLQPPPPHDIIFFANKHYNFLIIPILYSVFNLVLFPHTRLFVWWTKDEWMPIIIFLVETKRFHSINIIMKEDISFANICTSISFFVFRRLNISRFFHRF